LQRKGQVFVKKKEWVLLLPIWLLMTTWLCHFSLENVLQLTQTLWWQNNDACIGIEQLEHTEQ
jgi:hypothetical protein